MPLFRRTNKSCRFFPCHNGLEDCTFCYCPFYPCLNRRRGNYVYSSKLRKNIWSCQDCNWIHSKKIVDEIFSLIRKSNFIKTRYPVSRISYTDNSKIGIIILGHGSKLHKANRLISEVIKIIKRKKNYNIIEPSYLQFYHPDLSASINKIIKKGCKKVVIVPFFLFKGNHVKRDIPRAIKKEVNKYPDIKFVFTKSLGEDAKISEIVFRSINETIRKCA